MTDAKDKQDTRPEGTRQAAVRADAGPAGGEAGGPGDNALDAESEWVRARDSLKTKWIASVVAFWVSASVWGVVLLIDGKINLILTSIVLGMLVIGMWLKTRYQLHLRNEPPQASARGQEY